MIRVKDVLSFPHPSGLTFHTGLESAFLESGFLHARRLRECHVWIRIELTIFYFGRGPLSLEKNNIVLYSILSEASINLTYKQYTQYHILERSDTIIAVKNWKEGENLFNSTRAPSLRARVRFVFNVIYRTRIVWPTGVHLACKHAHKYLGLLTKYLPQSSRWILLARLVPNSVSFLWAFSQECFIWRIELAVNFI